MTKKLLFLFALITATFSFTSCDQCLGPLGKEKLECSNGGTCNDGACDCLKGYFGNTCDSSDVCQLRDVICEKGNCDEGICYCDAGYEGETCNTETRRKFIGIYNVTESCLDLDTTWGYNITIEENFLNGANMYIYNLFNYSHFPINGYFSKIEATGTPGTNDFTIFSQKPDGGEKSIVGTGSINVVEGVGTTIHIDYTTTNGNKTYGCSLEGQLIQ